MLAAFAADGAELPTALVPFRALPYSWEMHVQRELAAAAPRTPSTPHGAIALRAHQQAAVHAIAAARTADLPGFLLADDVGLGKTITAWAAQIYWTYADATIEEKIARIVAGRIQSMKEMIGDDARAEVLEIGLYFLIYIEVPKLISVIRWTCRHHGSVAPGGASASSRRRHPADHRGGRCSRLVSINER